MLALFYIPKKRSAMMYGGLASGVKKAPLKSTGDGVSLRAVRGEGSRQS